MKHRGKMMLVGLLVGCVMLLLPQIALSDWCSKDVVCVDTIQQGNTVEISVRTLKSYDITLTLNMSFSNMQADVEFPYTATFSGLQTTHVATLSVINPKSAWRWKGESFHWVKGTLGDHDDSYLYSLPYASGNAHKVIQGYNGTFSHYDERAYCTDWAMPEGTPVHAAREGIVTATEDSNTMGGPDQSYADYGNYVTIRHNDGTTAEYWHFQPGGVRVSVGQHVEAGELIALSGNTGWSDSPHLHFCVYHALDGYTRESIPIQFNAQEGSAITLEQGEAYTAL